MPLYFFFSLVRGSLTRMRSGRSLTRFLPERYPRPVFKPTCSFSIDNFLSTMVPNGLDHLVDFSEHFLMEQERQLVICPTQF